MRSLNPDQLRTFIEVVELGSFTAAAKRLALSQPAVSLQVRELEARCGVQLLQRHSKRPYPTEAGRQLLQHAERILKESNEALSAMTRFRNASGHHVRIGMTLTSLMHLAGETVRRLKRDMPQMELSLTVSASHLLADEVRNRNLDLAIVTLPQDMSHLKAEVFYEDDVHAILPVDFCTPMPVVATPAMMAGAPFVTQSVGDVQSTLAESWFRLNGQSPHGYVEMRNLEACRAAVAAGLGVSIVPGIMAMQAQPGVVVLPLDPPITRKIAVIEHEGRKATPSIERVRTALLQCRPGHHPAPMPCSTRKGAEGPRVSV